MVTAFLIKMPKRGFCRNFRNYFREYCHLTSIHGIRYFGERRTNFERGWWIIVFLMSLSCCAYFITMVYKKWESSPIIISLDTREKPIYEIPFPAVTICPETKAKKYVYNHSKMVAKLLNTYNLTEKEYQDISYMSLLCDFNVSKELSMVALKNNISFDNYFDNNNGFFNFLSKVSPPIQIKNCKWMNSYVDCTDLFRFIWTDEGVCATFNMMDSSKIYSDNVYFPNANLNRKEKPPNEFTWSLDHGYTQNKDIETFPHRALPSGATNGLTLEITEMIEYQDDTCKESFQGYKVILHTPIRVPRPRQQYFRLSPNEAVIAAVQPVMITTSATVERIKPQKRKCYFENEKPLKYFKVYTQRNCELECLTNFTLKWCSCVSFFMPKENGTTICGFLNKHCVEEAEQVFQKGHLYHILGIKGTKNTSRGEIVDEFPQCDCLQSCTDLSYEVTTSASPFNDTRLKLQLVPNDLKKRSNYQKNPYTSSKLIVYFKNNQFITSKRQELFGPTDFLGNFGGLLGLFTGFSILSLMEIIYFLTVRIICNIKLYGNWSGPKKEKDLEKN